MVPQVNLLLVLTLIIGCLIELNRAHKLISDIPSTCPLYLSLSPLNLNAEDSFLVVNWGPGCDDNPPESIGIYNAYPSAGGSKLVAYFETNRNQSGSIRSNIKLGKYKLPVFSSRFNHTTSSEKCFSYFAVGYRGKQLQTLTCLVVEPMWMSLIPHMATVPLKNIMIPGTHCSGCYYNKSAAKHLLTQKFGFTQNFDVWSQLMLGIRYLDFNIGYFENQVNSSDLKSHFWIVNEGIFITPISHIFEDIKKFVKMSGDAILIDFSQFPLGFTGKPHRHLEFVKILESELGHMAFRRNFSKSLEQSYDLTLKELSEAGTTLLLSYNQPEIVKENNLFWPSWERYTTSNVAQDDIQEYMRRLFTQKHKQISKSNGWIFLAIQGVEGSYSNMHNLPTARERADVINKIITTRLGGPWSLKSNIVAIDFFMSTNLIDIAIHTNRHKSFELNEKQLIQFDIQD